MTRSEDLARLSEARRGHLATVRRDGRPHLVVVTFATLDATVVTAIDEKPKTTTRLQRIVNIEANPNVSFLVDHYAEDWERLWWVRVDGTAVIHHEGEPHTRAIDALADKYPQYQTRPPRGPVIAITPDRVTSWAHSG